MALNDRSQSYKSSQSLAIWDHTVLPATRHKYKFDCLERMFEKVAR